MKLGTLYMKSKTVQNVRTGFKYPNHWATIETINVTKGLTDKICACRGLVWLAHAIKLQAER